MSGVLERVGMVLEKYEGSGNAFLDLLSRVKQALESSEMVRVPIEQIQRYKGQPRKYFNEESLKRLSKSIDSSGQIQAGMIGRLKGTVSSVPFQLIDGERRWSAIGLIPPERRPLYKAELIEADEEVLQFLIAGIANTNREGHQPLETTDIIERYRQFGIPMEAVADLLGISRNWAYHIHGLKQLPKEVKALLDPDLSKDKRLPLTAAIQISKFQYPERQIELALKVVRKDITLARLRAVILGDAEKSGTPIRMRSDPPLRQWQRRDNKIRALARALGILENMVDQMEVQNIMRAHPSETSAFFRETQKLRERIEKIEDIIKKARGR
ncbi:MAG: ParB N-terminal domain-containing protein [bacterium]|nr:ParB N-terminal domain-containing protein [bacterium]